MKKQWKEFLNSSIWAYDIVPCLVKQLDEAVKASDYKGISDALIGLATQGITLDPKGNLQYFTSNILK